MRALRHRILAVCAIALLPSSALTHAGESTRPRPEWQKDRAALDQHFVCQEFRIYYTLQGKNALRLEEPRENTADAVPGKIRDLALQLLTARRCYVEGLGLRHPFASPRYQNRVKFVDVNVWDLPSGHGMAGDGIVNYHRDSDPPEGVEVVTIDLSTKNTVRNLSPAHELFHVFQNGYAQFKTPWYYEGVARWLEDLLRAGVGEAGELLVKRAELEGIFRLSYGASRFWEALARATDGVGKVQVPADLRAIRYSGSDKPVLEDDAFFGAPLLKALLEELDRQDDVASRDAGLDPLNWPEARQRSGENNPYIWNAVLAACRGLPSNSPELRRMLSRSDLIERHPNGG
jgi:hypothetical protein